MDSSENPSWLDGERYEAELMQFLTGVTDVGRGFGVSRVVSKAIDQHLRNTGLRSRVAVPAGVVVGDSAIPMADLHPYASETQGIGAIYGLDWRVAPVFPVVIVQEEHAHSLSEELDYVPHEEAIYGIIGMRQYLPAEYRMLRGAAEAVAYPIVSTFSELNTPEQYVYAADGSVVPIDDTVGSRPPTAEDLSDTLERHIREHTPGTREHLSHSLTEGLPSVRDQIQASREDSIVSGLSPEAYREMMRLLFERGECIGAATIARRLITTIPEIQTSGLIPELYVRDQKLLLKNGTVLSLPYSTQDYQSRGAKDVNIVLRAPDAGDTASAGRFGTLIVPEAIRSQELVICMEHRILTRVGGDRKLFAVIAKQLSQFGYSWIA